MKNIYLFLMSTLLTGCVDIIDESSDAAPTPDANPDNGTYYVVWTPSNRDCTIQATLPDQLTLADDQVRWSYAGCQGWGHDGVVTILDQDAASVRLSQVQMVDCSGRKLLIESFQLYWSSSTGTTMVRAVCTTEYRITFAK